MPSTSTQPQEDATERDRERMMVILAIQALSDALYKNERIDDEGLGLRALRDGGKAATAILSTSTFPQPQEGKKR